MGEPTESPPTAEPPTAPGTPAAPPARPFAETRAGASLVGGGSAVLWFVFGLCLPGVVIGAWLAVTRRGGAAPSEADVQALAARFLPWITGWALVAACIVAGALRMARLLPAAPAAAAEPRAGRIVAGTLLATAAAIGLQYAISAAQKAAGVPMEEQPVIREAMSAGGTGVALAIVLFAPLGEELVFRRIVHRSLAQGWGRGVAATASVLLFALVHLHPPAFAGYVAIGLMCTIAYEFTGQFGAAVFVHAANNLVAVILHRV